MTTNSLVGIIPHGIATLVTILEQGSLTGAFEISIPSGAILAFHTTQDGGKITNLWNNIFSTNSTTISLPPRTTFMILAVGSTGQFYIQQVLLITTAISQVIVPLPSTIGSLLFNNQLILTSIGGSTFSTQYLLADTSNSDLQTSDCIGVIYSVSPDSISSQLAITSTIAFTGYSQFVSGIFPVRSMIVETETGKIFVTNGDLFGIIPSGGQGIITVVFSDSQKKVYKINPGSILAVLTSDSTEITDVSNGYFTTSQTCISFPTGSVISVLKVSIDGTLIRETSFKAPSAFRIIVATQSLIGIIRTSGNGRITTIGDARFTTQLITASDNLSVAYFGLLHLYPT